MLTRWQKTWIYSGDWGWTAASGYIAKWLADARRGLKPLEHGSQGQKDIVKNLVHEATGDVFDISIKRNGAGVIIRERLTRRDEHRTYWDITTGYDCPTVPGEMGFRVHVVERD